MNEIFEKIYNNNTSLNEDTALFEKVYMEVKMLNEMNPKLKALLAAGLIGTAGLGAASCSMPTDDPYDAQYTIEQPTPENPEEIEEIEDSEDSEEITDSEDSEDFEETEEIGDNGGEETVTEEQRWAQTPFGQLGVIREDAEIIASEDTSKLGPISAGIYPGTGKDYFETIATRAPVFVYTANQFVSYQGSSPSEAVIYKNSAAKIIYVIPADMEEAFDVAIDVYNNAQ